MNTDKENELSDAANGGGVSSACCAPKTRQTRIAALCRHVLYGVAKSDCIAVANEAEAGLAELGEAQVISTENKDGWVRIAPYGDHPKMHVRRVENRLVPYTFVQRLTRDDAEAVVNDWRNSWFGLKKLIKSVPLFKGHPDAGRPDTASRPVANGLPQLGTMTDFEVREDGLYAEVSLSEEGMDVVNSGGKFISIHWWNQPMNQKDAQGRDVYRPVRLISGGLTSHPNIAGVESLANMINASTEEGANNKEKENTMDRTKLIGALNEFEGVSLTNEATEEQILAAVNQVGGAAAELVTAKASLTATQEELTAAQAAANSARGQLIDIHLDTAIAAGRLTPAERPGTRVSLVNSKDLDKDLTALANREAKIKTAPETAELGGRKPALASANEAGAAVREYAQELMNSGKFNHLPVTNQWDAAWQAACNEKPDLVKAMNGPAIKPGEEV